MTFRIWAAIVMGALLLPGMQAPATAGNVAAVRKQVESSLQVSGTITIAPDGSVMAHTLDPKAPLGGPVVVFLDSVIAKWRFEPVEVDGKIVTARVPMHLRLVAKPADAGKLSVSIVSTYFGSRDNADSSSVVKRVAMAPPSYPRDAMVMGGQGTVYLVVQVGRDGQVINIDAEQVNLRVVGTENQMGKLRKSFANAALRSARKWIFRIPTTGEGADDEAWLIRVPVSFALGAPGDRRRDEARWESYVPGPRNIQMPWAQEKLRIAGAPDALPEDGIYPLSQGATLLSPPAG